MGAAEEVGEFEPSNVWLKGYPKALLEAFDDGETAGGQRLIARESLPAVNPQLHTNLLKYLIHYQD